MLAAESAIEIGGALFVGAIMCCYFYLYAFHNAEEPSTEPQRPSSV